MSYYEFTRDELIDIITGKVQYVKCPFCDNNGHIHYDGETGEGESPFPKPEWGEWAAIDDCDKCDGLGFVPRIK